MKFNKIGEVWYLTPGDMLASRKSGLILDEDEVFTDIQDAERTLQVVDGLEGNDIAVTLKPYGKHETVDYVVSGLANPLDGSGLLVARQKLNQAPRDWSNPHINERWAKIEQLVPGTCDKFCLNGLYEHIRKLR